MQTGSEFLTNLLQALLPNRAAPVLGRVLKAHEGPGKTKYSVDVQVVTAGTLEDTDQIIADVPISPIWATKQKRGVYAIPPKGQLVIVEFLGWNPAYPYAAGIWSDEYEADEFSKDQFIITDGDGMKIMIDASEKCISIETGKGQQVVLEDDQVTVKTKQCRVQLRGDKMAVRNHSQSLFTILDTHFQNCIGMKTVGSPAQHVVSPDDIVKLLQTRAAVNRLLEA